MVQIGELWVEYPLKPGFTFLIRQVASASVQMIANGSSWKALMQSATLPPTPTIMLSHFPLPHPGSMRAIAQNSCKLSRWSRDSQTDGGLVPVQFPPVVPPKPLSVGKILLQWGYHLVISLSSMKSLGPAYLFFLAMLTK